jgi:hypothetical protein
MLTSSRAFVIFFFFSLLKYIVERMGMVLLDIFSALRLGLPDAESIPGYRVGSSGSLF